MSAQHNESSQCSQDKRIYSVAKSATIGIILTFTILSILLSAPTKTSHAGENIWTWTGLIGTASQILTDPTDPNTVYVRNYDGVMKTSDGGLSWSNITGESAAWIAMAPSDPNVLYTSTISGTSRTNDGGSTWKLVHSKCCVYAVSPADWREAYLAEITTPGVTLSSSKLSKTIDGGESWTTLSGWPESNGRIYDIVIAASAPNILLAETADIYGGPSNKVYKSIDGGQNWSVIGGGSVGRIFSVTFDPKNSNTIYLATDLPGGWKSIDGGQSWQPLANGLQRKNYGFVINPDNTQVIYAANSDGGVRESLDGGASWVPINHGIDGLPVRSIGIASNDPLEIYAGLDGGAGLWKLTRTTIQDFGVTVNDGSLFTNQTGVTLTLTAPPGTTQMIISNDGGFGVATWEAFATTKPWTITNYGSLVIPRTVYAKFKTNGQISGQYQDDIILDQTPPTGSVQITDTVSTLRSNPLSTNYSTAGTLTNTVYLPIVSNNYWPGRRSVKLLLSAEDDVSGVDSMLVSNDSGMAGAQWQIYTTELDWWVSETGTTTIYVKYNDRAGNESQVYSAVTFKR